MKDAMIFGTAYDQLRQEALAKDFDFNTNCLGERVGLSSLATAMTLDRLHAHRTSLIVQWHESWQGGLAVDIHHDQSQAYHSINRTNVLTVHNTIDHMSPTSAHHGGKRVWFARKKIILLAHPPARSIGRSVT